VAITKFEVDTSTLLLDLAANDAGAGNDSITSSTGNGSIGLLRINAGTGTNTLTAQGGTWNVSTAVGVGGVNLDCLINNANVTFTGNQTVGSVTMNNGTVSVAGTSVDLQIQQLAVSSGTATASAGTGNAINVTLEFSIAAGATLNKTGSGTLNIDAEQLFPGTAFFTAKGGVTNFNTDSGGGTIRRLNMFADTGDINLNSSQHVASLATNFGDIVVAPDGNRVVFANAVSIGGELGRINLNDNDMVVDYTNASEAADVRTYLHNGRNGGAWNGLGIMSGSAATNPGHLTTLGSMEATEYKSIYGAGAKFHLEPIDNTCVLIKYTWYGDTDFNGKVDGADYARMDSTFNNELAQGNIGGWFNGDLDYNGKVDGADYALIDSAFNAQGSTLLRMLSFLDGTNRDRGDMTAPGLQMTMLHFDQFGESYVMAALSSVPEPGCMAVLSGALGMWMRRRRRQL
jgi:hypothetical protein